MKRAGSASCALPSADAAILRYSEIVIGSSLEAAAHAFTHRIPLIHTKFQEPHRFERFPVGTDLRFIGVEEDRRTLNTHDKPFDVGTPRSTLWRRLMFLLSMEGLAPMSDLCHSIRFDSKRLVCSNEYSKIAEVEFETAYYYKDPSTTGIINKVVAPSSYKCYDWIGFNRGGKHDIDLIRTEDRLTKEIWFYKSDRIDGDTPIKDACAISYLKPNQIEDFDYSETMVRFKTIHEMEKRGMVGPSNGYDKNGKRKRYRIKAFPMRRELEPIFPEGLVLEPLSEKVVIQDLPDTPTLIASLEGAAHHYQKLIDNTNE